jgi:hypothetical protein
MDTNTTLKRNEDLLSVDMDGETVMMDINSGNYFGINPVGSHIWDLLEETCTVQTILDGVQESFEINAEDNVQEDIINFLTGLLEQKLIQEA